MCEKVRTGRRRISKYVIREACGRFLSEQSKGTWPGKDKANEQRIGKNL